MLIDASRWIRKTARARTSYCVCLIHIWKKECETVMQEKSTDELDAQLRNTTPDCMDKYYKENELK